MSTWGWQPRRSRGKWEHGPLWLKPLSASSPWIALVVSVLMIYMSGTSLSTAQGVLVDLPEAGLAEGEATELVALVMPMSANGDVCVFFDDARYTLGSAASVAAFGEHLAARADRIEAKTLLVLSDRSVACGELSKVAAVARASGLGRILFANKRRAAEDSAE